MIHSEINSLTNEKIKRLKKLHLKKYREQYAEFLVENFKIINDAHSFGVRAKYLFLTQDFLDNNRNKLSNLLEDTIVYIITPAVNKFFSEMEAPAGIAAVYDIGNKDIKDDKNIVYLNGINDPGNLGNIIRSAVAFSLNNIVLDEGCVDVYNYKTIAAARDAIFKVNISFDKNRKILKSLRSKKKIYVADSRGKELHIKNNKNKICLVLGSEAHGVSEEIKKMADNLVAIKTSGGVESLNVASAAAILFHRIFEE